MVTSAHPGRGGRALVFARLGKLDVYQHFLALAVPWSLLPADVASSGRTIAVFVAVALGISGVVAAAGTFDDIQGYRDGIDPANYAPTETLRKVSRKPLVTGEVDARQALTFARVAGVAGVAGGVAGFALSGETSGAALAAVVAFVVIALATMQYSYGLKLSYHPGGGEAVLAISTAASLAVPYVFVTGELTGAALVESAVVGAWLAQAAAFSNSADKVNDRAAARMTVAATLSDRGNRVYVVTFFGAVWLVTLAGIALGHVPAWALLTMLPCWVTQARQVVAGVVQGEWLRGRRFGFRAMTLGIVGLAAANVLAQL